MDYAEAREAFFGPREAGAPPPAIDWSTPARDLRDAIEPLATISFWSEPAYAEYEALGLDFLTGYVWSRSSVMGAPDAGVVAAAFAVFEPGAIAGLLGAARDACGLDAIRRAREAGAVRALREVLGQDPDGLADAVAVLRRASEALDVAGRPLHAGLRGLPWPDDRHGQLWHACSLLREGRGDGHVGALVAHGIGGLQANLLTELWVGWSGFAYTATRAWPEEAVQAAAADLEARGLIKGESLTADGLELRRAIEAATDQAMAPALAAAGDDLGPVVERCAGWAAQVVERGWFPPDDYKRASG
jgi:hypothetical protein